MPILEHYIGLASKLDMLPERTVKNLDDAKSILVTQTGCDGGNPSVLIHLLAFVLICNFSGVAAKAAPWTVQPAYSTPSMIAIPDFQVVDEKGTQHILYNQSRAVMILSYH